MPPVNFKRMRIQNQNNKIIYVAYVLIYERETSLKCFVSIP
jgi:hypothetical protein